MNKLSTRAMHGASTLTIALGLILSLVAFPVATSANTSLYQTQPPASVTVPAGGSVNLTVRGFCLDFGKTFPTADIPAKVLADAKVREALNYAIQKGYTDSNARQVELAIWNLRDNTWHADPHDIGTEIVNNATSANDPANGTGTSIVDAIAQGTLTATAKFTPQTADEFYGDGQVTIKNTGTSDMSVYMPVGVTFSTGDSSFQDLVAYQLSVPAQATGTVSATGTVTGTVSPEASATSVVTGTATSVLTGTATTEATSTAVVTGTATTAVTTPTTESTAATTPVIAETPTTEATTAPIATDTPAATETPTPVAGILPQTGSGDGFNGLALAILLMGLMLTIVGSTALVVSKRRA